jgi:hypothetical protein
MDDLEEEGCGLGGIRYARRLRRLRERLGSLR